MAETGSVGVLPDRGLEFLFMISPFALHFYSAYGGPLRWLTGSPATAWLTWFYLPHISETTSPVLNVIKPLGFILVGLGSETGRSGSAR